jgi:hypothetical protein
MDLHITELNNTLKNVYSLSRNRGLEARVPEHMYPTHCSCANRYGTAPAPVGHVSAQPLGLAGNVARFIALGR